MQYLAQPGCSRAGALSGRSALLLRRSGAGDSHWREPRIPAGYDFDAIDAEALLKRLTVTDGRLTLPSGMSYRMLLLPTTDRLTPTVLARSENWWRQGATVLGARPSKSPSLADYPKCDAEVAVLADELWETRRRLQARGTSARAEWSGQAARRLARRGRSETMILKPDDRKRNVPGSTVRRRGGDLFCFQSVRGSPACPLHIPGHRQIARTLVSGHRTDRVRPYVQRKRRSHHGPSAVRSRGLCLCGLPQAVGADRRRTFGDAERERCFRTACVAAASLPLPTLELSRTDGGSLIARVSQPGAYEVKTRFGKTLHATVATLPEPVTIGGPWVLRFPPKWGAGTGNAGESDLVDGSSR